MKIMRNYSNSGIYQSFRFKFYDFLLLVPIAHMSDFSSPRNVDCTIHHSVSCTLYSKNGNYSYKLPTWIRFSVYDRFNSEQFTSFLQESYQKFGKVLIVMDKAAPHKSKMVEQYVLDNPDICIEYLPTGCLEYNPVEAC